MNNDIPSSLELFRPDGLSGQNKTSSTGFDSTSNRSDSNGADFSDSFEEANQALNAPSDKVADTSHSDKSSVLEGRSDVADTEPVDDASTNVDVNVLSTVDQVDQQPTIVDNFSPPSVLNLLGSDGSDLESLLAVLQQAANDGGIEGVESLINPEELSELMALLDDGKELPLNSSLLSGLDTIKPVLQSPAGAGSILSAGNLDPNSPIFDPKLLNLNQSNIPNNLTLSSLAEALEATVEPVKPLSTLVKGTNPELFSLDTEMFQKTTAGLLPEGAIEKALTEGLFDTSKGDTLSARVTNDSALNPISNNNANPLLSKAQMSMAIPFQQAQWGQAVAERVMWMSSQGVQEAEIHLDPPELGPLQVKVSVANDQAHVSFVVQHGSVREALDQNAMRLREMFEAEGINLADVDVSDQSEQQTEGEAEQGFSGTAQSENGEETLLAETPLNSPDNIYSLVNTYA